MDKKHQKIEREPVKPLVFRKTIIFKTSPPVVSSLIFKTCILKRYFLFQGLSELFIRPLLIKIYTRHKRLFIHSYVKNILSKNKILPYLYKSVTVEMNIKDLIVKILYFHCVKVSSNPLNLFVFVLYILMSDCRISIHNDCIVTENGRKTRIHMYV